MSDTNPNIQEPSQNDSPNTPVETTAVNPYDQNSWAETAPVIEEGKEIDAVNPNGVAPNAEQNTATPPNVETNDEEILEPKDYLKREFGWEDPELGKKELEELRALKNKPPVEFKFENEDSEKAFNLLKEGKIDDLYEILDTKRKIAATDKMSAVDILKLQIELQNKHYTKEDINDIIEDRYSFPEKPIQDEEEDAGDYKARVDKWQAQVDKITRRTERDAIEAKQQLAKLNSELKLPDIPKADPKVQEPSQESLDAIKKIRESYLQHLESNYNSFEGFTTKVKDESVELPISFKVPDEEKAALKQRLQDFDPNDYLEKRWFANNNPDIKKMMADIYVLENLDKILLGVSTNAANQRLAHFIKEKSNIDVSGSGAQKKFDAAPNGQPVNPYSDKSWVEQN